MMRLTILLLSLTILFCCCYTDNVDNTTEIVIVDIPTTTGDTGVNGKLVDTNSGDLISGYSLNINGQEYDVTSEYFFISDIRINKKGQLIEVIKNGALFGVAYPYLLENDMNKLSLTTFAKTVNTPINGATHLIEGAVHDISLTITLDQLEGGNNDVVIETRFAAEDLLAENLGNSAYSKGGDLLVLNPISGFHLGFNKNGRAVSLKSGSSFDLMINSSATAALFMYDIDLEYWIKVGDLDGTAQTMMDDGFFMIAEYEKGAYQEGLTSASNEQVSYLLSTSEHSGNDFYTTELGRWAAVCPIAPNNVLSFYNECNELIMQSEIATEDINEDTYIDFPVLSNFLRLETQVIECGNEATSQTGIQLESNDAVELYLFSDTQIDTWVPVCDTEVEVSAYDLVADQLGPALDWTSMSDYSIDYLSACSDYEDGFSYLRINGDEKIYNSFTVSNEDGKTILESEDEEIRISFAGMTSDLYMDNQVDVYINDADFGSDGYVLECENSSVGCGLTGFNVTHYEQDSDGWFRVSFSGEFWMRTISNPTAGYYEIEGVIMTKR